MNSLNPLSAAVKKIVLALAITSSLALTAAAQNVDPSSQQGRRYGEPGFRGEPINLNVVNADVRDILSYITDQYGINFVIDKSVKDVPVTVKVNDVPWNIALDSVLQAQGLGIQVNGNILRVADAKTLADEGEVQSRIRDSALDSAPLYTEFVRLNYARAFGTLTGDAGGNQLTAGTQTGSGGGPSAGGQGTGGSDQGIMSIVRKRLSRRGTVEVDGRSNTLIITDVRQNIDAIKQLISLLDQPEPQVEIETRIVVASRTFTRDIGVQLSAFVFGPNAGAAGSTIPGAQSVQPIPPGLPSAPITNPMVSQITNTVVGLTTGVFGTAQISALISLGEQKGQAKVIATPRVTALNNRPAEIKSGTKIPIVTVQPGTGTGGAIIATTTYVDVPLRLAITPQITNEGTVILNVVAENSSTAQIVAGAPPAINSQSMTTQVTVPDGGTTVVGGVLFDDEREDQNRTPGISRVPILGNLFKRKALARTTNEILFFITPRISRPDYAKSSAPRDTTILQPVPMGNPPSNSTPVEPVLPSPGMSRPEPVVAPTPTGTPKVTN